MNSKKIIYLTTTILLKLITCKSQNETKEEIFHNKNKKMSSRLKVLKTTDDFFSTSITEYFRISIETIRQS